MLKGLMEKMNVMNEGIGISREIGTMRKA